MSTPITPVPDAVLASEFPSLADRPAGTYNAKAKAWADSENAMATRAREIAVTAHDNATIAYDAALDAEQSKEAAATSATSAEASNQSAIAAAIAAGAGAGLPVATNPGDVLAIGEDGVSREWKALPRAFGAGDIMTTMGELPSPEWLPCDGSIYLKDSYPDLADAVGSLYPGEVWGALPIYGNPSIAGFNSIVAVAYGNGKYVAGGQAASGTNHTTISSDGITWVAGGAITGAVSSLRFMNNLFVAIGNNYIATSVDGAVWNSKSVSGASMQAAHGNGVYVAAGTNGGAPAIYSSPDAVTWTARTSGFGASAIYDVTFGAGVFVAVGADGKISTSSDGINWAARTSGVSVILRGVVYADGKFIAVGNSGTVLTSTDGFTWAPVTTGIPSVVLSGVVFRNELLITWAGSTIWYSHDAITWVARTVVEGTNIHNVDFDGGVFLIPMSSQLRRVPSSFLGDAFPYNCATDGASFVAVGTRGTIAKSENGRNWLARDSVFGATAINAIAYGGGVWVAVGAVGKIATSPDGWNWTLRTSGVAVNLNAAAYGDGKFVAVGVSSGGFNTILTSSDGEVWAPQTTAYTGVTLQSIVYANGSWRATDGGGGLLSSTDAVTWSKKVLIPGYVQSINGIAFANGIYVAVGTGGFIATSIDGTTWTQRVSPVTTNLHSISYGVGRYVVVGESGVLVSDNAINWTVQSTVTSLRGVAFNKGLFVAVGIGLPMHLGETSYDPATQFAVPNLRDSVASGFIKTGVAA